MSSDKGFFPDFGDEYIPRNMDEAVIKTVATFVFIFGLIIGIVIGVGIMIL